MHDVSRGQNRYVTLPLHGMEMSGKSMYSGKIHISQFDKSIAWKIFRYYGLSNYFPVLNIRLYLRRSGEFELACNLLAEARQSIIS